MKLRAGFVSNSSTASFILLGFPFDESKFSDEEIEEFYENYDKPSEWESGQWPIIGKYLAYDEDMNFTMRVSELQKYLENEFESGDLKLLAEKLGKTKADLTLYSGVCQC
jgi:hypothetical protein